MSDQMDWWRGLLAERASDGATDAANGVFEWPWPNDDDPQNQDENAAYKEGFDKRRKELGDVFKWA